ncbi:MAG: hypothetical protein ACRDRL_34195, partial [Sciscionella sp.]
PLHRRLHGHAPRAVRHLGPPRPAVDGAVDPHRRHLRQPRGWVIGPGAGIALAYAITRLVATTAGVNTLLVGP